MEARVVPAKGRVLIEFPPPSQSIDGIEEEKQATQNTTQVHLALAPTPLSPTSYILIKLQLYRDKI